MLNALTIDVESWQQLFYRKLTGNVISPSPKVVDDTAYVLNVLSANDVRATFFVLGNVAETFPDLVATYRPGRPRDSLSRVFTFHSISAVPDRVPGGNSPGKESVARNNWKANPWLSRRGVLDYQKIVVGVGYFSGRGLFLRLEHIPNIRQALRNR